MYCPHDQCGKSCTNPYVHEHIFLLAHEYMHSINMSNEQAVKRACSGNADLLVLIKYKSNSIKRWRFIFIFKRQGFSVS